MGCGEAESIEKGGIQCLKDVSIAVGKLMIIPQTEINDLVRMRVNTCIYNSKNQKPIKPSGSLHR